MLICVFFDKGEEHPYLTAIPTILIGLEPVLFCSKTLWEGFMYHLGCHPLTFRPGEVLVLYWYTCYLCRSSSYVITDIPIIHSHFGGSVAWRIRPRANRTFAQVRTEAIIVAFDSDLRRPLLERFMGNPEGWPSKAQRERFMAPWLVAWTVGGSLLFVWGVFILGREWWRW